jgi:hypothetical protein
MTLTIDDLSKRLAVLEQVVQELKADPAGEGLKCNPKVMTQAKGWASMFERFSPEPMSEKDKQELTDRFVKQLSTVDNRSVFFCAPEPISPRVEPKVAAAQLFGSPREVPELMRQVDCGRYRLGIEFFDFRKKGAKYAKLRFDVAACQRRDREYIGD